MKTPPRNMKPRKPPRPRKKKRAGPVSLWPLDFDTALKALLGVCKKAHKSK